ncbi:thermonuclease family protein [Lentzea sp. NPDC004782]|uniref:thermonuclease family protein n=1 Tax=Lentzea sp. NPDC004782 TaxID=3154458 RepID=UPI0033BD6A18
MTSPAESAAPTPSPGPVRRFWWGANQRARIAVLCLGVLTALATTGAAGFLGAPPPREHGNAGHDTAVHRGDSFEVTVHTVSDVDVFDGVEAATGLVFHARVAGVGRIADCWLPQSLATAQTLLRDKTVRLTVRKDVDSDSDRIVVDVRLPDGADYAQTIVHDGMAPADLSSRDELGPVEYAARQEQRGLWAAACTRIEAAGTTSSSPSSSSEVPATTTTTAPPVSSEPPRPPEVTTTTPDDSWTNLWLGKMCLKEGARKTGPNGQELVCARNAKGQLRWRRAD